MTLSLRQLDDVSETATVTTRGVTVNRSVWAAEEQGLSVVQFDLTSDRDDAVRVHLREPVPSGLAMENLGPHPEYGGDKWTKTEDREFEFADRLEPGGATRTLYGAKGLTREQFESLLTDPVVTVDPVGDESTSDGDTSDTMSEHDTTSDDQNEGQTASETTTGGDGPVGDFDDQIPRVDDVSDAADDEADDEATGEGFEADAASAASTEAAPADVDPTPVGDGGREPEEDGDAAADTAETETPEDDDGEIQFVGSTPRDPDRRDAGGEGASSSTLDLADPTDTSGEDDDAEPDSAPAEAATDESTDGNRSDAATTRTDDRGETPDEAGGSADRSVLTALVDELSSRDLTEEEATVLRESLGIDARQSLDVRLGHVQERVDTLSAYADAIEEFIDENGTAEQVLEDLQDDTADLRSDVADLRSALSSSEEALDAVEDRVGAVESRMVTADEFDERLAELDDRLVDESEFEATTDGLVDELDEIRADVETGKVWRNNLSQAIQIPGVTTDGSATGADGASVETDGGVPDGESE